MNKRRSHSDLIPVGEIIPDIIRRYRPASDASLIKVWDLWTSAVGNDVAANAAPAAFKNRLLIVHVSSSVWMQQLRFLKADLLQKLNSMLGRDCISDIKFKIGPV